MFWGFSCWTSKTRHLKASPWITAMGADWTVNHQMYCSPVGRINIGNARFWKPAVCWNLTFLCVAALGFFRLEHFVYLVWKVSLNHPLVSLTNVEILERLELRWSAQQTSRLWLHHRRGHPPPDVKVRWRMWCNTFGINVKRITRTNVNLFVVCGNVDCRHFILATGLWFDCEKCCTGEAILSGQRLSCRQDPDISAFRQQVTSDFRNYLSCLSREVEVIL